MSSESLESCHLSLPQVFLGNTGAQDIEGNELPRLVYVSREKRPGYQHHKKAGAENALVLIVILCMLATLFGYEVWEIEISWMFTYTF